MSYLSPGASVHELHPRPSNFFSQHLDVPAGTNGATPGKPARLAVVGDGCAKCGPGEQARTYMVAADVGSKLSSA